MHIRTMNAADRESVMEMMRVFYASEAVLTNGSEEIFSRDVDACISDNPFLEGYILEEEGVTAGYVMLAKSFSTEFGKPCIWIEDLYLQEEYRGRGMGVQLLQFVQERYPQCLHRLEVEEENTRAVRAYEKSGFSRLPYVEMVRNT